MKLLSIVFVLQSVFCQAHIIPLEKNPAITLRAEVLESIHKDGKVGWLVRTTLSNYSEDTLFYFSYNDCEISNFAVDTVAVQINYDDCGERDKEASVIALAPGESHTCDIEVNLQNPKEPPVNFYILMFTMRATNIRDHYPTNDLVKKGRGLMFVSNKVKT